jgi:RimJ/RimL family protein N-acetyltransferase
VDEDYEIDGYLLKNYIHCTQSEHEKILAERNSDFVRLRSINQEHISIEAHMEFVEKLKNRKDSGYWLIYKDEKVFGGLSLVSGDVGLFKFRENAAKHAGGSIIWLACRLAFEKLGLQKLNAECFENNPASWKSFEAEGFQLKEECNGIRYYVKLL